MDIYAFIPSFCLSTVCPITPDLICIKTDVLKPGITHSDNKNTKINSGTHSVSGAVMAAWFSYVDVNRVHLERWRWLRGGGGFDTVIRFISFCEYSLFFYDCFSTHKYSFKNTIILTTQSLRECLSSYQATPGY